MDNAARCLYALLTLKYTLRTLSFTMSTGCSGRHQPKPNKKGTSKRDEPSSSNKTPVSDPDSDVEILWSEIDAAEANYRRVSSSPCKARRREKARNFLRVTVTSSRSHLTLSPQRNRFRVTDLNDSGRSQPPLPAALTPELDDIPLPPVAGSSRPVVEEKEVFSKEKMEAVLLKASSSSTTTTSAFLSAKARSVLQEVRRNSSGGKGGGTSKTSQAVKYQSAQVNLLEEVRTWANTGLGQQLIDNPRSWVG
jgi:hypothetical protein